jgi:(heptosyl)LPS beta-1,4-glucosyltransferase
VSGLLSPARLHAISPDAGISAVVVALNEANHITQCLRTVRWADELLVVLDSRSSDETRELATKAGARVVERDWGGWAAQRNFALSLVQQRWVLFIDGDERVPLNLAREMREAVNHATDDLNGFWVPRQNLILGHWVRHAGWYPDHQLRLFRADRGRYDPDRSVHELVQLEGRAERLREHLVHHNYVSWRQFWTKQMSYARAEARQLHAVGQRAKPRNLVLQPVRELRRRYITLGGFKAGLIGLQLSLLLAASNFEMYRQLLVLGRLPGETDNRG